MLCISFGKCTQLKARNVVSSLKVSIWTRQYTATAHRDIPAMNELSHWLVNNLPENDNEFTLVHGDFRLDNLIFHPTEVQHPRAELVSEHCISQQLNNRGVFVSKARVIAVLDWELSTTGNPLVDLAYFLMPQNLPANLSINKTVGSLQGIEGNISS